MQPTSGSAFGYPTSGAGYGGEPPLAPPPRRRNVWIIPLVISTLTLVVLVAAIIVVLDRRDKATGGAMRYVVDRCVVGTWTVTKYTEQVPIAGVGDVTFTGKGAEVRLRGNGTGTTDYRNGTTYTATISGVNYRLVVTGTVTFTFRTGAGTVTFTDVKANGKETITREDTGASETADLVGNLSPASFTCGGNSMVESTNRYRSEMARLSRKA